jgi:hypothetical protein
MARLVLQVAAALRVVAVQAQPKGAEAVVAAAAVRRRRPRVPWRKLLMAIPTSVDFGTSRTPQRRESRGLTRLRAAVVVDAALAVVAAVAAQRAAEPLRVVAMSRPLLRAAVALPVAAVRVVARRVALVLRALAVLQLAAEAEEADGFLIHQTVKSRTRRKQEPNSRTSS